MWDFLVVLKRRSTIAIFAPAFHSPRSQLFQLDDVDGTDSANPGDEFLMCQMSLLVPDVSIVYFGLETRVERWQDVDRLLDGDIIFLICFSPVNNMYF